MGFSSATTVRLDEAVIRSVRRPRNSSPGGVYASRSAPSTVVPEGGEAPVKVVRELAREGRLADVVAVAGGAERVRLSGAAYAIVWPIVFARVTRRVELTRGHPHCASGVERLADECLDRFHDDVESVVDDLLTNARRPVFNLEAWVTGRLNAATVNGHRRQRGRRGALQRPRLPQWVAAGLGHDPWLISLATEMLVWVGVDATAGSEVWPLESWSHRRGLRTGDWAGSDPGVVAREVETVLTVMRGRPSWFESYIERPLGVKQAPVAVAPVGEVTGAIVKPLPLGDPDGSIDDELLELASNAVRAIDERLTRGDRAEEVVVEVVRAVFGGAFTSVLNRAPHAVADPLGGVSGALANAATVNRLVTTVMAIIGDRRS
ncbi:hypothetical protein AB0M54_30435 [Actinoplanes sp. NPDC051470]|uniref:hypothetical protein n=1 Tax=unclassified Actinoplanes TaxID=2626549 RepID=UPI00342DF89E